MKPRILVPIAMGLTASVCLVCVICLDSGIQTAGLLSDVSESGCSSGCEDHRPTVLSRVTTRLSERSGWEGARVGDRIELGFKLGGMSTGSVTFRERLEDQRVVMSVRLPNGDDLFIARSSKEWEGRVLPKAGGPGWRIRGEGDQVTIEELERGAMICSWTTREGAEVAGLPPVVGPLPERSASTLEVSEIPPVLNSLLGANGVIYLDFDGETVSGTQWNTSFNNGNPIVAGGPGFTNTQIETVWKGVSEDYRPFNVNVTTDRSVFESYPVNRRAMLVFTPDNEWYGTAGGVAYVDVFGSSIFAEPGWVFTDQLANSADNASEAASHEAGHMLGMRHDGTNSLDYYEGHGSGATSWAPIMGVGYYSVVTQWSKGEYPDANRLEDDLAIITSSRNGLGYRGDDHSGSIGGATPVSETGVDQIGAGGLIERNTDVDVFSFQTGGGTVTISATNAAYDPNLDIRLRLLSATGVELVDADPVTSLDASFSQNLAAGTYHLEISGVGKGDLISGYSDYGSLGEYSISGSVPLDLNLAAEIVSPSVDAISLPLGTGLILEGTVTGGSASWETVSQPAGGSVTFSSPSDQATEVVFGEVGLHVLRLKGTSGGDEEVDDVTVIVEASGAVPGLPDQAAGVDLGRDRTVYGDRIDLAPAITDDSVPAARGYEWSVLSGDGQLSSTSIETPELVFPAASPTELRLVVDDGISRTFDEVTLTASFSVETLIGEGAAAKALVVTNGSLGNTWQTVGFADGGWLGGSLGVGFDAVNGPESRRIFSPLIGSGLDVESAMYKKAVGCFVRVPFEISDPGGVLSMTLRMKFDDGFVAYINGVEVARSNVPAGAPSWDTAASSDRRNEDALSAVTFALDPSSMSLVSGVNMLAVHGMNSSTGNQERTFVIVPDLEAVVTETPYFAVVSTVTDPLMRDPEADADGDGRVNLYEHAAGTDLTVEDDDYRMLENMSSDQTSLILPVAAPDDVRYSLEYCSDLNPPWTEIARKTGRGAWIGQQPIETQPVAEGRERIRFATPDGPHGFFRLKLELVAPES